MSTAFDSIKAKIIRANKHIDNLDRKIESILDEPHSLRKEYDAETRQLSIVSNGDIELPVEWSIIAGEAVHQLRSSLDHLVHALVVSEGRVKPTVRTQFPILDSEDNRKFRDRTEGISSTAAAIIESLQPYHPSWTHRLHEHPLCILRDLSNTDKHRNIVMVQVDVKADDILMPNDAFGVTVYWNTAKTDAKHLSFYTDNPEMDVEAQILRQVSFPQICAGHHKPVIPTLVELSGYVDAIVLPFRNDII